MGIIRNYKYTDTEKNKLLKSIVVLVDTRENKNDHITEWFEKKKIKYEAKALGNGDYSFYLPKNSELNIDRDLYFDRDIMIERKASADELALNFTKHRSRFEEELATYKGKKYLMIESTRYSDIVSENYRSQYKGASYLATLHTFSHRYDMDVVFMPENKYSGLWIYMTLTYWLRERLR